MKKSLRIGNRHLLMDLIMNNTFKINRGEIWLTDLDPTIGHEQAKIRPCLIISDNTFNNGPMELIVILPITPIPRTFIWFVPICLEKNPESGLLKNSYVMCNQIRTISKKRIKGKCLGIIQPELLNEIEYRIKILLSL